MYGMSVREHIEPYALRDQAKLVDVLVDEFGVIKQPSRSRPYLGGLPYHAPRPAEDHTSMLSFNNSPLPDFPIEALVIHAELFSDDILMCWTQEQDLIFEATLG
jgi:hypothetical protein